MTRARGAAGDRRMRAGLPGNVEPSAGDRRRDGPGLTGRGAEMMDMEFIQFHPTAPRHSGRAALPALRGAARRGRVRPRRRRTAVPLRLPSQGGARAARRRRARDRGGDAHRRASARLSRSDASDATRSSGAVSRRSSKRCSRVGLDLRKDLIPVLPARTTRWAACAPIFAAERACQGSTPRGRSPATGVHGANRLASNSLLEGLVFGWPRAAAMLEEQAETEHLGPGPTRSCRDS